jgi:hypothetical protein
MQRAEKHRPRSRYRACTTPKSSPWLSRHPHTGTRIPALPSMLSAGAVWSPLAPAPACRTPSAAAAAAAGAARHAVVPVSNGFTCCGPAGSRSRTCTPRQQQQQQRRARRGPPPAAAAPAATTAEALMQQLGGVTSVSELATLVEAHPAELVEGDLAPAALFTAAQLEAGAAAQAGAAGRDDWEAAVDAELDVVRAGAGAGRGGVGQTACTPVQLRPAPQSRHALQPSTSSSAASSHRARPQQEALLDRLSASTARRLGATPVRTTAGLALALAGAGYYSQEWYAAAAAAAPAGLAPGGGLEVREVPLVATVLAAGFSAAGHYDEALFDALAARVRGQRRAGGRAGGGAVAPSKRRSRGPSWVTTLHGVQEDCWGSMKCSRHPCVPHTAAHRLDPPTPRRSFPHTHTPRVCLKVVEADDVAPAGPAPLLAVAAACLEVQHFAPNLLAALAASVRAAGAAALPPGQLADLLLVLAFFRAAPDDIVADASAALAAALGAAPAGPGTPPPGALGPLPPPQARGGAGRDAAAARGEGLAEEQMERLLRAAALLAAAGAPLDAGLLSALAARPPGRLLALGEGMVADPEGAAAAAAQPEGPAWEAAGLLAPAQVVGRLKEGLGLTVAVGAVAGEGSPLRAAVDLSIEVPGPSGIDGGGFGTSGVGNGGGAAAAAQQAGSSKEAGGPTRRVVVAVLDEESYCVMPPGRLRGSTAAQVFALQALGWAVMPLPLHEWQELGDDAAAREAYLKARVLAAVG